MKIGVALGSGSARGWAHIGVLQALSDMDIRPEIVCGTSVGAFVGAFYANDQLEPLEKFARGLDKVEILQFMDLNVVSRGGFMEGEKLLEYFRSEIGDKDIGELKKPFAAVASCLRTGQEIWFREGSLLEAVRASISLPGIFTPYRHKSRWLVDGGLVNPVPVSVCRALGADLVIAINLNGELVGRHFQKREQRAAETVEPDSDDGFLAKIRADLRKRASSLAAQLPMPEKGRPGLLDVMAGSINIMQDRITRARMAGDPPDVLLAPGLGHVGLLEFDRAEESIEEGRACVERAAPQLEKALAMD